MVIITPPFSEADHDIIKEVLIRQQGTIIYPTETFYALGCIATSSIAVKKIYQLKNRDTSLPLLVLVNNWSMLENHATHLNNNQKKLLQKYWPGPLTSVLKTNEKLAKELNYSGNSIGIRMTSSKIAQDLIQIINQPIVGTSANRSKEKAISDFKSAITVFGKKVDIYIDGGNTPGGKASTLIDMTDAENFITIRQGTIKAVI